MKLPTENEAGDLLQHPVTVTPRAGRYVFFSLAERSPCDAPAAEAPVEPNESLIAAWWWTGTTQRNAIESQ